MKETISFYVKYKDKSKNKVQEFTFDPKNPDNAKDEALKILHNIDCEILICELYEGQI